MNGTRNRSMASYAARLAAALCLFTSVVRAEPTPDDATRAVARDLGVQGIDAFRASDFADADAKLDRAYRLFATPTLGLWSARAREQLGHWVEAAERYRETVRLSSAVGHSETQIAAQEDARRELEELLPRIPTLTVQMENAAPAEVQVSLDGVALHHDLIGIARPTNVGAHTVVAVRGRERLTLAVTLAEADKKLLPLRFTTGVPPQAAATPPPTAAAPRELTLSPEAAHTVVTSAEERSAPTAALEPNSALRPIGTIALGIGALGFATWGVAAFIADDQLDDCPSEGGQHTCTTQGEADAYNKWKTLSTVGFITGTAFAVIGLGTWLFAVRQEQASERVGFGVGPTGASVRGFF